MKKILSLIIILISVSITTIPVKANSYAEEWLKKKQAQQEKYMNELEADGNLTQEAIDSISKGTSSRKANTKSKTTTNKSTNKKSTTSNNGNSGKGWVYSTDELHVTGLPTDENGYTQAGWYGDID